MINLIIKFAIGSYISQYVFKGQVQICSILRVLLPDCQKFFANALVDCLFLGRFFFKKTASSELKYRVK